MQRFTISLDDKLAQQFDDLMREKGYSNRSEAVRDLLREQLDKRHLSAAKGQSCLANVSYVYCTGDGPVTARIASLHHDNHDLVVTKVCTLVDHRDCVEVVVLRGEMGAVVLLADKMVALRGVRHGKIHLVPLQPGGQAHTHSHSHGNKHKHYAPIN